MRAFSAQDGKVAQASLWCLASVCDESANESGEPVAGFGSQLANGQRFTS
jgi:hypothetical protein